VSVPRVNRCQWQFVLRRHGKTCKRVTLVHLVLIANGNRGRETSWFARSSQNTWRFHIFRTKMHHVTSLLIFKLDSNPDTVWRRAMRSLRLLHLPHSPTAVTAHSWPPFSVQKLLHVICSGSRTIRLIYNNVTQANALP
jgi:hypothetical protein